MSIRKKIGQEVTETKKILDCLGIHIEHKIYTDLAIK